jgi:hypothetical protein
MDGTTTSWLSGRIASLVPNVLPQAVAHAESCWNSCVNHDDWHCCGNGVLYSCYIFANC